MKKNKILLVEDSLPIQTLVHSLTEALCTLVIVDTIEKAKMQLKENKFALILLDVMLPDGSGYNFCEALRKEDKFKSLPIIFLTSKTEIADKVHGFSLGADDYLVKPIEPKEFVARIESRLKRQAASQNQNEIIIGDFRLNTISQKAYLKIETGEKNLDLTPIEFKLLSNFMRHDDKVITREEIKSSVWGKTVHVSSHTIDTHISSLRKKIEPCGKYIKSIVKRGYVFSRPTEEPQD